MARGNKPTPPVGTVCEHRYKGEIVTMEIVRSSDGEILFQVLGVQYASPTAAAKAIVGHDQFINGRKFWHFEKYLNELETEL